MGPSSSSSPLNRLDRMGSSPLMNAVKHQSGEGSSELVKLFVKFWKKNDVDDRVCYEDQVTAVSHCFLTKKCFQC